MKKKTSNQVMMKKLLNFNKSQLNLENQVVQKIHFKNSFVKSDQKVNGYIWMN